MLEFQPNMTKYGDNYSYDYRPDGRGWVQIFLFSFTLQFSEWSKWQWYQNVTVRILLNTRLDFNLILGWRFITLLVSLGFSFISKNNLVYDFQYQRNLFDETWLTILFVWRRVFLLDFVWLAIYLAEHFIQISFHLR